MTFNKRSTYIYRATSNIHGFFIRKSYFDDILNQSPMIAKCLKRNIIYDHFTKIRIKMEVHKNRAMEIHN